MTIVSTPIGARSVARPAAVALVLVLAACGSSPEPITSSREPESCPLALGVETSTVVLPDDLTGYTVAASAAATALTVGSLAGPGEPTTVVRRAAATDDTALPGASEIVGAGDDGFLVARASSGPRRWDLSWVDASGDVVWSGLDVPAYGVDVAGGLVVVAEPSEGLTFYSTADGEPADPPAGSRLPDVTGGDVQVVASAMPTTLVISWGAVWDSTTGQVVEAPGAPIRAGGGAAITETRSGDFLHLSSDGSRTPITVDLAGADEIVVCDDWFYTAGDGQLSVWEAGDQSAPVSRAALPDGDVEKLVIASGAVAVVTDGPAGHVMVTSYRPPA